MAVRRDTPGPLTWLFLPGGPGLGSQSLAGLVDAAAVPGRSLLVDLPGDGSNLVPGADPYAEWPGVLLEALDGLSDVVFVGHSTGGMYLLSVPELEARLKGLVLVSSAPHAGWTADFAAMTAAHPLPAVDEAAAAYEAAPTDAALERLAVASAPWNFTAEGVDAGAALLTGLPYNRAAVDWSAAHFDATYAASWWPVTVPTLIVSGAEDRIVTQALWDEPRFQGANVTRRTIDGGAHFPWVERPDAVRAAFHEWLSGV